MEADALIALLATAGLLVFAVCSIRKAYREQNEEEDPAITNTTDADAFKAPSF